MLTTASGKEVKIKHLHLEIEFRSANDNNGKDLSVARTQIVICVAVCTTGYNCAQWVYS